MKSSSAKAKGRRLQQTIAEDIITHFPSLTSDDVRSTSMGAQGEDVLLSPCARRLFPYSIEAKNQERLSIWSAVEQCEKNARDHTPLIVIKKNHTRPFAVIPWEHFIQLAVSRHGPTPPSVPSARANESTPSVQASKRQRLLNLATALHEIADGVTD